MTKWCGGKRGGFTLVECWSLLPSSRSRFSQRCARRARAPPTWANCARGCLPAGSRRIFWRSIAPAAIGCRLAYSEAKEREGGIEFAWREEVIATPNSAFRRIDVFVFTAPEESRALAYFTGFVAQPPTTVK